MRITWITLLACLAVSLCTASAGKAEGLEYYTKGQYVQALEELTGPALTGDQESRRLVGLMYLKGLGTEKDPEKAAYWLQQAASQGDLIAQGTLGEMYLAGSGVPQDDHSAFYWGRQAAEQGYAPAQVLLGRLYLEGRSVERDPQMALSWFEQAAGQGHAEGQYGLAGLLERGEGTRKDEAQALRWYKAAADQGFKAALDAVQRLTGARPAPPVSTITPPISTPKITTPAAQAPATVVEKTTPTVQKKRVALLIANQDYRDKNLNLTGPINDAKLIQNSLLKAGFKVTLKTNLTQKDMNLAISSFLGSIDGNTVSLVYYSGHGIEIGGVNYLIPTDFRLTGDLTATQAAMQSVDIARLYADMEASAEGSLNITILDACRDNPFKSRGFKNLSVQTGLKAVSVPGGNGDQNIETFTAYAAESGQVARDTLPGQPNGPYATVLARQIAVPGQVLEVMFRNVTQEVMRLTKNAQRPASYSNLVSEFIFTPGK